MINNTWLIRNGPKIAMIVAIGGGVATTVAAVRATPKAMKILEEAGNPDSFVDKFKLTWSCYLPTISLGLLTSTSIVLMDEVHIRKQVISDTLKSISDHALDEYRSKTIEVFGEKKEGKVLDAISEQHINENPVTERPVVRTGRGDTLFYDELSGRYFESDIEYVKKAQNEINNNILQEISNWVSVNELYDQLDLNNVDLGHEVGWSSENKLDIYFTSTITNEGKPCVVLNYHRCMPNSIHNTY